MHPISSHIVHSRTLVTSRQPLSILLLNIMLSTTLLSLPNIVLLLSLQLCVPIASDTSEGTTNCTRDTVCDAGAVVVKLTLGFLAFTFGVLLGSCALEILFEYVSNGRFKQKRSSTYLRTNEATNSLLSTSHSLVP